MPTLTGSEVVQIINTFFTFVVTLIGIYLTFLVNSADKKMKALSTTVVALEENTNSLTKALVKVTGESERAIGLKAGADAARLEAGHSNSQTNLNNTILEDQTAAAYAAGVLEGAADEKRRMIVKAPASVLVKS